MKAIGGPLSSGELQWDDSASGYFLRAFNLTARRQYYPALMANSDFFIAYDNYASVNYIPDDNDYLRNGTKDEGCDIDKFQQAQESNDSHYAGTAWYPGVLQSTNNPIGDKYPNTYWWDLWALGDSAGTIASCPDSRPDTFGMFDPIDLNNTSALGLWKPYFFERSGIKIDAEPNSYYSAEP